MGMCKYGGRRRDRLVTDIAEASRVDAQLSRAKFDSVDLGHTIERLVVAREARNIPNDIRIAFARPSRGVAVVMGDEQRLLRVIENLVDNALSFSPPGDRPRVVQGKSVSVRVELGRCVFIKKKKVQIQYQHTQ